MGDVVNIHPPTVEENILAALDKGQRDGTTEELYVLRAYRVKGEDDRQLEWFTTECKSKIWSIGALHFLAHKLQETSEGWDEPPDPPEEESA